MSEAVADADHPIVSAVASGYDFEGPALELGGLMLDANNLSDTHIRIPLGIGLRNAPIPTQGRRWRH